MRSLGEGNNGIVWSTSRFTAIKTNRHQGPYQREIMSYMRLDGTAEVAGLAVPILVDWDDDLLIIEMTIVQPPCMLDFASAYPIESAPRFPDEIMAEWLAEKREQFGADWPRAAAAMRELERDYGLRMTDVHPGNIMLHPIRRGPQASGSPGS
jgi:hypothetical protein